MNLFAYGTLMCGHIMQKVAACRSREAPATLGGYRRRRVRDAVYPAITAHPGSRVRGVVYFDVPADAWARLDAFEGEMYCRRMVQVSLDDGTTVDAATYVVRPECADRLESCDWSFEEFLRSGRKSFEAGYSGFDALEKSRSHRG